LVILGNVLILLTFNLVILMKALTEMQESFLHNHVKHGMNPTQSARVAGYADPKQSAFQLVHSPAMIAKIRHEREKLFHTDLATTATATLRDVMESEEAPASAKVSACRTVLEVCGMLGKHSQKSNDNKSLSDMTADDLAVLIGSLEDSKQAMAKVIDGNNNSTETTQSSDIIKD